MKQRIVDEINYEAYTGVGSRRTPDDIIRFMINFARAAHEKYELVLRSGAAKGADQAFECGCDKVSGQKQIFYAKDANDDSIAMAKMFHPTWEACNWFVRQLHGRNSFQVMGPTLGHPSRFVICWTPDGAECHQDRSKATGGTGTAISIATHYDIPVINLANKKSYDFAKGVMKGLDDFWH